MFSTFASSSQCVSQQALALCDTDRRDLPQWRFALYSATVPCKAVSTDRGHKHVVDFLQKLRALHAYFCQRPCPARRALRCRLSSRRLRICRRFISTARLVPSRTHNFLASICAILRPLTINTTCSTQNTSVINALLQPQTFTFTQSYTNATDCAGTWGHEELCREPSIKRPFANSVSNSLLPRGASPIAVLIESFPPRSSAPPPVLHRQPTQLAELFARRSSRLRYVCGQFSTPHQFILCLWRPQVVRTAL